jgi:hypothetical protein
MPVSNNVEVSAFYHEESNRLTEYRGPYEDDTNKRVYRYIESFTGKRFAVAVEVMKSFNFDVYPFVKIECCLDGRSTHSIHGKAAHLWLDLDARTADVVPFRESFRRWTVGGVRFHLR